MQTELDGIEKSPGWGLPSIGIPAEVLFNSELTLTEKFLFGFIRNLAQSEKGCWATNRYLGLLLNVGPQTISNGIAKLKHYEYIRVVYEREHSFTDQQTRRVYIDQSLFEKYRELVELGHEYYIKRNPEVTLEDIYGVINSLIVPNKSAYNIKEGSKEDIKEELSSKEDSNREDEPPKPVRGISNPSSEKKKKRPKESSLGGGSPRVKIPKDGPPFEIDGMARSELANSIRMAVIDNCLAFQWREEASEILHEMLDLDDGGYKFVQHSLESKAYRTALSVVIWHMAKWKTEHKELVHAARVNLDYQRSTLRKGRKGVVDLLLSGEAFEKCKNGEVGRPVRDPYPEKTQRLANEFAGQVLGSKSYNLKGGTSKARRHFVKTAGFLLGVYKACGGDGWSLSYGKLCKQYIGLVVDKMEQMKISGVGDGIAHPGNLTTRDSMERFLAQLEAQFPGLAKADGLKELL